MALVLLPTLLWPSLSLHFLIVAGVLWIPYAGAVLADQDLAVRFYQVYMLDMLVGLTFKALSRESVWGLVAFKTWSGFGAEYALAFLLVILPYFTLCQMRAEGILTRSGRPKPKPEPSAQSQTAVPVAPVEPVSSLKGYLVLGNLAIGGFGLAGYLATLQTDALDALTTASIAKCILALACAVFIMFSQKLYALWFALLLFALTLLTSAWEWMGPLQHASPSETHAAIMAHAIVGSLTFLNLIGIALAPIHTSLTRSPMVAVKNQ